MHIARRTAALLAAGVLTVLPVLPAAAHDELTAVSPEPGSVLTTAPEEVELTFSGELVDIGHQVRVTDSAGRSVTAGELESDGNRIVQPLTDTGSADETYQVLWRAVSGDGHPVEGTFAYEVGDGAASPAPGASVPAADAAAQAQDAAAGTSASGTPLWLVAVVGAGVALAALGAVSLLSHRRRRS